MGAMTDRLDFDILGRESRGMLMALAFAASLASLGAMVWLWPTSLSLVAVAYQQACADNPDLLGWSSHVLPLLPLFLGILLLLAAFAAALSLYRQLQSTRRLVEELESRACPVPYRASSVFSSLDILDRTLCVQDAGLYAFCYGFLSPRICISTGLIYRLSRSELRAVLLHEMSHLHGRDPLRILVSRVVASALALLPIAAELRERYYLGREIAADRSALARVPVTDLASALLKVFSSGQYREVGYVPVGTLNVTRERIRHLAESRQHSQVPPVSRRNLLASAFVAAALFVATVGFAEASGYWAAKGHDCRPVPSAYKSPTQRPTFARPASLTCIHADKVELPSLER
ncbi:MAG: M56 family metallopeptidase [Chloroflexi bacterium]|nr:M56 family metallopeptidase [Chloroflexota bacterium]